MNEPSTLFTFIAREKSFWIPGLYLLASVIGMLDSWIYYRQFGINIFFYSEVADFLLASLRSPTAWPVLLLVPLMTVWDQSASHRVGKNPSTHRWLRWYGSTRYRQISWYIGALWLVVFVAFYSRWNAQRVYEQRGKIQEVRVALADNSTGSGTSILLGSTISFIFLYDPVRDEVRIHPYENVLTVGLPTPERN